MIIALTIGAWLFIAFALISYVVDEPDGFWCFWTVWSD